MEPAAIDTRADRRIALSLTPRSHTPCGHSNNYPLYFELHATEDEIPAPRGGYLLVCHEARSAHRKLTRHRPDHHRPDGPREVR